MQAMIYRVLRNRSQEIHLLLELDSHRLSSLTQYGMVVHPQSQQMMHWCRQWRHRRLLARTDFRALVPGVTCLMGCSRWNPDDCIL